jgi:hypothetical protein
MNLLEEFKDHYELDGNFSFIIIFFKQNKIK